MHILCCLPEDNSSQFHPTANLPYITSMKNSLENILEDGFPVQNEKSKACKRQPKIGEALGLL